MMHVHGQPPFGYPCSKLTYHIYGSMTELEPVVYLCKRHQRTGMALTPAEKQRRYREKRKAADQTSLDAIERALLLELSRF